MSPPSTATAWWVCRPVQSSPVRSSPGTGDNECPPRPLTLDPPACPQFVTKECAEAAAQDLAQALRRDAEAVSNPMITAQELQRVTHNLATMCAPLAKL
eukprot:1178340-Prorocentrum_minimum.AAC.1